MPVSSGAAGAGTKGAGAEIELNTQNAAQVLQSPGALLLQVGDPGDSINKKLLRLRAAAGGRLPLVLLDCNTLPQVCQALQIRSSPTVLLMARGQVVAALENDLSPQMATAFVERTAQALGLKVNLAEGATEQLAEAEEAEWRTPAAAEEIFVQLSSAADMQADVRVRAAAGRARCMLRLGGRREEAKALVEEVQAAGHGHVAEVRQAAAMLKLDEHRPKDAIADLQAAVGAQPTDAPAVEALSVALFWDGREGDAVDAGLKLLRKKRSDEARQLVLLLIEALGPGHPRHASARKSFSNALFV